MALWCWLRPPFQLQCANGIWNIDPLSFEFVPNIRAHRVVGLIEPGVIAHVVFDLVRDGVIAELNEENFHRRARKNVLRTLCGAGERIFDAVRRHIVIDADPDAHGVGFGRVMKVDDRGANDLVVRNIEINVVVRTEAG